MERFLCGIFSISMKQDTCRLKNEATRGLVCWFSQQRMPVGGERIERQISSSEQRHSRCPNEMQRRESFEGGRNIRLQARVNF